MDQPHQDPMVAKALECAKATPEERARLEAEATAGNTAAVVKRAADLIDATITEGGDKSAPEYVEACRVIGEATQRRDAEDEALYGPAPVVEYREDAAPTEEAYYNDPRALGGFRFIKETHAKGGDVTSPQYMAAQKTVYRYAVEKDRRILADQAAARQASNGKPPEAPYVAPRQNGNGHRQNGGGRPAGRPKTASRSSSSSGDDPASSDADADGDGVARPPAPPLAREAVAGAYRRVLRVSNPSVAWRAVVR